jgi:hypothetical protein
MDPQDGTLSQSGGVFAHGPVDGVHTHSHSAYGQQGGDLTHEHAHAHHGDGVHGHDHSMQVPGAPIPVAAAAFKDLPVGMHSFIGPRGATRQEADSAWIDVVLAAAGVQAPTGTDMPVGALGGAKWAVVQTDAGFHVLNAAGVPWTTGPEETYQAALSVLGEQLAADQDSRPVLSEGWSSAMSFEGVSTGDGRYINPGATQFRPTPLPLMLQTETAPGHMTALLAGAITTAGMVGTTAVGGGDFDDSPVGQQFHDIIDARGKFGVSIDVAEAEGEPVCDVHGPLTPDSPCDMDCNIEMRFSMIRVMGVTGTPFPAFEGAFIQLASAATDVAGTAATAGQAAVVTDGYLDQAQDMILALGGVGGIDDPNGQSAAALVVAANIASARLMEVLGVADPNPDPDAAEETPTPDPDPAKQVSAAEAVDAVIVAARNTFALVSPVPPELDPIIGLVHQADAASGVVLAVLSAPDPDVERGTDPVAADGTPELTPHQPVAVPVNAAGVPSQFAQGGIARPGVQPVPLVDAPCAECGDQDIIDGAEAIVAAAGAATAPHRTVAPPADWFEDPGFTPEDGRMFRQPDGHYACPLTVDDPDPATGLRRVYGHMASWFTCHTGIGNRCQTAPRSTTGYAAFNLRPQMTAAGTVAQVGHLTMGCGHADSSPSLAVHDVQAHYDGGPGAVRMAIVHMGQDDYGPWFAGYVNPEATEEQIRAFSSCSVSGDWREVWAGKGLEVVACLAGVTVPGFPVAGPSALAASAALVAAGVSQIPGVSARFVEGRAVTLIAAGIVRQPHPWERQMGELVAANARQADEIKALTRQILPLLPLAAAALLDGLDEAEPAPTASATLREEISRNP